MMEYTILYLIVFIVGSVVGSFLNVCIYRIPREKSIILPSSHCVWCGHKLNFVDLIPIMGYIIRKGKCKYCKEKFSVRYPLVEFLTGILFLATVFKFGFYFPTILILIFISILIVITFIDIDFQIIPDSLNIIGVMVGLTYAVVNKTILSSVVGMVGGTLFFILVATVGSILFKKESMGGGDIKLAAALGAFLGWKHLSLAIFLSFAAGGILAIFLLLLRKKGRKDYIPFGPAMVFGTFVAIFFGDKVLSWYSMQFGVP